MPTAAPSEAPKSLSFSQFMRVVRWSIAANWQIDAKMFVVRILSQMLLRLQPVIYGLLLARAIDQLVIVSQTENATVEQLYPYLAAILLYFLIVETIRGINQYAGSSVRLKSRRMLQQLTYKHVNSLGIQTIEEPGVNDQLRRAEQYSPMVLDFTMEMLSFLGDVVSAISAGVVLITLSPVLAIALIIIGVLQFIPNRYFVRQDFRFQFENTERNRKMGWDISFLSTPRNLLEVTLLGAYKFFDERIEKYIKFWVGKLLNIRRNQAMVNYLGALGQSVVLIWGYLQAFTQLVAGTLSVGGALFMVRMVDSFSSSVQGILNSLSAAYEFSIQLSEAANFFDLKAKYPDGKRKFPELETGPKLELFNLNFSYPGSDKLVFKDLNLTIQPGEKIAIVGHNGAGKTTLVKLLARVYRPQTGGIVINDEYNLNDVRIADWYKNLGILFQEYNQYSHLSVEDNIFMGQLNKPKRKGLIKKAAEQADADGFISEFKDGYDQTLSEQFRGGTRLSTGQSQKLAIARFFYRNAPLVIFDEPTAAIDAVSEANIFNRIYDFFSGKTVIIISHRFSTVRNADRIIVLDHGEIVEQGSHADLMKLAGKYSHAFKLQAEGYQENKEAE
jgi:ATP-binding cassette, subfamily B, bacterial